MPSNVGVRRWVKAALQGWSPDDCVGCAAASVSRKTHAPGAVVQMPLTELFRNNSAYPREKVEPHSTLGFKIIESTNDTMLTISAPQKAGQKPST